MTACFLLGPFRGRRERASGESIGLGDLFEAGHSVFCAEPQVFTARPGAVRYSSRAQACAVSLWFTLASDTSPACAGNHDSRPFQYSLIISFGILVAAGETLPRAKFLIACFESLRTVLHPGSFMASAMATSSASSGVLLVVLAAALMFPPALTTATAKPLLFAYSIHVAGARVTGAQVRLRLRSPLESSNVVSGCTFRGIASTRILVLISSGTGVLAPCCSWYWIPSFARILLPGLVIENLSSWAILWASAIS